ncbi:phosphotransferase [Burkholderia gladioli]|uniref:phosphotransferase n=1 Tax=Burkholderia gladioli TaxID=28095 RepID=UPI00163E5B4C|nr:phosphotransferase [Burkholderia gladioli]
MNKKLIRRRRREGMMHRLSRQAFSIALNWARQKFLFDYSTCVSVRPWGRVFSLHRENEIAYLKCISSNPSREIDVTCFVRSIATRTICEIIAVDRRRGYLLMKGGQAATEDIDLDCLVEEYAFIQSQSLNNKGLFHILPIQRSIDQLQFFGSKPIKKIVNLSPTILGQRRYSQIARRIRSSVELRRRLRNGIALLEHGDLHLGNIVMDERRRLRIIDWADAAWAPIGSSLPSLPLGTNLLARSLRHYGTTTYIDHYIRIMSSTLKVDEARLSKIMIAGAISGLVQLITELIETHWRTHRHRMFINRLLGASLKSIALLSRDIYTEYRSN